MAGRWKTLIVWVLIAVAALTCLPGFELPAVDATEEGAAVVSDQLSLLASDTILDGTGTQDPTAGSNPAPVPETSLPAEEVTTVAEDPVPSSTSAESDTAAALVEPLALTPEEELAAFMSSRVGLVPYGSTDFPAHDINVIGEFVFKTPLIQADHFVAAQSPAIPSDHLALTTYDSGIIDGFDLYKNMTLPVYGDYYIAMSSGGTVSFSNLAMEVTELCAQELIGVRTFPILNFWTTKPGADLPLADGEVPTVDPFSGKDYKVTVIKMTADNIKIPNFHLSVRPGTK